MFKTFVNNIFTEALKQRGVTADDLYHEGLSWIFTRINIDSPFLIYWLQHGLDLKFLSFSNTIEYFVPNTEETTENQGKVVECHLDPLSSIDEELMSEMEAEDEEYDYNLNEGETEMTEDDEDAKNFDILDNNIRYEDEEESEEEDFDNNYEVLNEETTYEDEEETNADSQNRYGEEEEVKKDLLVEHVVKETTEMKVGQDGTKLCSLTEKIQSSGDFFSDNNGENRHKELESADVKGTINRVLEEENVKKLEVVDAQENIEETCKFMEEDPIYEQNIVTLDKRSIVTEDFEEIKEIEQQEEKRNFDVVNEVEASDFDNVLTYDAQESIEENCEIMDEEPNYELNRKIVTFDKRMIVTEDFEETKEIVQQEEKRNFEDEVESSDFVNEFTNDAQECIEENCEILDKEPNYEIVRECENECGRIDKKFSNTTFSDCEIENSEILGDIKIDCNGNPNEYEETEMDIPDINIDPEMEDLDSSFILNLSELKNVVKDMENIKTDGNLRASIVLEVVEADGTRSRSLTPTFRSRQNSIMSSQLSTIEDDINFENENLNNTIEILTNAEKLSAADQEQNDKRLGSEKKSLVSNLRARFENN